MQLTAVTVPTGAATARNSHSILSGEANTPRAWNMLALTETVIM